MTPVILLTGFLGSGKTTLLQRMLSDPGLADAAVLINEFGEVGLDHHLLDRIDDNVVLLKSGCVCCTVRGEVADALVNLETLRARGEVDFGRVVIETTGLADPYPVLQTLTAHPVLRSHFVNGGVVATVDAVNAEMQVTHRAEAVRQIAAADLVVLTKTDLTSQPEETALRQRLTRINPSARVMSGRDLVADMLRGLASHLPAGTAPNIPSEVDVPAAAGAPELQHHHHHHRHHDGPGDDGLGVVSFSLVIDRPVDWTAFGVWLTLLLHRHGARIFRVKGILFLNGEELPVAIHGVQHLVHAPTHMSRCPDGPRVSRLIFIVEGLEPERIRRSFARFTGLEQVRAIA